MKHSTLMNFCRITNGLLCAIALLLAVSFQQALAQDVAEMGLRSIAAAGEHPANGWPAEPSFLVPGLPLEDARLLGEKFGQNAVVWSGANGVPRLVLLR